MAIENLAPSESGILHSPFKLVAVLVDGHADYDESAIMELRIKFLGQGKLPRADASPRCPEMQQYNFAAKLVRTQALTGRGRSNERG